MELKLSKRVTILPHDSREKTVCVLFRHLLLQSVVAHSCNPITWEAEEQENQNSGSSLATYLVLKQSVLYEAMSLKLLLSATELNNYKKWVCQPRMVTDI